MKPFHHHENKALLKHLRPLIGQTITVFVRCGGLGGSGFTGILIIVSPHFIKLLSPGPNNLHTLVLIPLAKIVAITQNTSSNTPNI